MVLLLMGLHSWVGLGGACRRGGSARFAAASGVVNRTMVSPDTIVLVRATSSKLASFDARAAAVAVDHHAIAHAQLRRTGLGDGDRRAVFEADQNPLTGPAIDTILYRVAGDTAADDAEHRRNVAPAAATDLVSKQASGGGTSDRTDPELVVIVELDLLDLAHDSVAGRLFADDGTPATVGKLGAGAKGSSEDNSCRGCKQTFHGWYPIQMNLSSGRPASSASPDGIKKPRSRASGA